MPLLSSMKQDATAPEPSPTHTSTEEPNQSGLGNTIGKSAKPFVSGIASIVILSSTSLTPVYYVLFGVLNSTLSKVLKSLVQEPRPAGASKGGYGMPSSHAQSVCYFATVLSLKLFSWMTASHLYRRLQIALINAPYGGSTGTASLLLGANKALVLDAFLYSTCSSVLMSYCYYACVWRVKTRLHTARQTLVGAFLGISIGILGFIYEQPIQQWIFAIQASSSWPLIAQSTAVGGQQQLVATVGFRAAIAIIGGIVLYSKEIKSFLENRRKGSKQIKCV